MRWSIAPYVLVAVGRVAAADPISLRVVAEDPHEVADPFSLARARPVIEAATAPAGLARPPGFNDRWAAFEPRMPWKSVWAGVDVGVTAQLAESVGGRVAGRSPYAMIVPVSTLVIYGVHRLVTD